MTGYTSMHAEMAILLSKKGLYSFDRFLCAEILVVRMLVSVSPAHITLPSR
jgi:hypothetical protein